MDKEHELMHRLLDGDLPEEEVRSIRKRMESDPRLTEEFRTMSTVVRMLERSEQLSPSGAFGAEVMRRLPEQKPPLGKRIRFFFFGERTLRWNVATAGVLVLMLIATSLLLVRITGWKAAPQQTKSTGAVTITFRLYAPQAQRVALAGEFNRWNADEILLKPHGDGFWSVELPLEPGSYTYMFVVDGSLWVTDPEAEAHRDDGFGYKNAVLRVNTL